MGSTSTTLFVYENWISRLRFPLITLYITPLIGAWLFCFQIQLVFMLRGINFMLLRIDLMLLGFNFSLLRLDFALLAVSETFVLFVNDP